MARVMTPLQQFGAGFDARDGGLLPLTITGTSHPIPVTYELPVASAQIKSAILLAALNTPGKTTVIEPQPSRDHTEKMLKSFGAEIVIVALPNGGRSITLTGQPELNGAGSHRPGGYFLGGFSAGRGGLSNRLDSDAQ